MSDNFILGFTLGVFFMWFAKHIIDAIDEWIKEKTKTNTNADRICNMTDEELADILILFGSCGEAMGLKRCKHLGDGSYDCKRCVLEWLQSEVKESE